MPKGVPNARYTGKLKQSVIEDMTNNNLSQNETAVKYNISRARVQSWERIYLEEGPAGLYIERRGRACAANGTRKGRKPKMDKQIEEDLIAENRRLRMENEYLKKLEALVLHEKLAISKKPR
jgi:transposase